MEPIKRRQSNANFEELRTKMKLQCIVKHSSLKMPREGGSTKEMEEAETAIASIASTKDSPPPTAHFEDDYDLGEVVGEGANALVKKCYRKKDGQLLAVKASEVEEQHLLYLRKIFNRLNLFAHPCVIKYHAMYISIKRRTCHIVMDFITHPMLTKFIYEEEAHGGALKEGEIREITRQLIQVAHYLHTFKICHRDIKPDNILYDRAQGKIWLIDFGVSKLTVQRSGPKVMMTNTGTCEYKAPEIYEGGEYTESVDLWAIGVVLFEMVERRRPFCKQYLSDTIQSIQEVSYAESDAWERVSPLAKDLLRRLLKPVDKRLTAEEALSVPWFNLQTSTVKRKGSMTRSITVKAQKKKPKEVILEVDKPPQSPTIAISKVFYCCSTQEEVKQEAQPTAEQKKQEVEGLRGNGTSNIYLN